MKDLRKRQEVWLVGVILAFVLIGVAIFYLNRGEMRVLKESANNMENLFKGILCKYVMMAKKSYFMFVEMKCGIPPRIK